MKQGKLFDTLYDDQEADEYGDSSHTNTTSLYHTAVEGVIKQRLITYYREPNGQVKRVERTRNFDSADFSDHTMSEVLG
tara:strand:- start:452 stop:688 length:237 start_codon:yes stop_codon:yes gene_type:complete